ncbi:glycosyltransferase family 2 protein [Nocardia terpenica]|uniref:glycosyltransferase family 2 protein n=1 Tax=Nocardia terpenica TaxID=455432 RepID=UPI0002FB1D56|nr:glycosyltransferase [Nocardia terpenica]NQE90361.1 glycosyltransferase [Nocardia terpenica]
MSHLISIVTPVYNAVPEYVADAYKSLVAQQLPTGWTWEWIIQADGLNETDIVSALPDDDRIRFAVGRHGGPGVARTLALGRVNGELVKVLDADDQLTDGSLMRDISALERFDIGWTTSRVLDLLPDGSTLGFDNDPPEGIVPRGAVLQHWRTHNFRAQVHPTTMCIRTQLVLALGGWMALPASEDTGLLLAANAVADGYFSADVGLLYRKWPGQTTAQAAHANEDDLTARRTVIQRRAMALADDFPHWHYAASR